LDIERISRRNGKTKNSLEHFAKACSSITIRGNIETTSIRILVEWGRGGGDEKFDEKTQNICRLYKQAQDLRKKGERVISTDEMTGIQALQRQYPDKPMKPGQPVKREFEYIRHGIQTLIASFDISSGTILHESIGQTRTELDFVTHVQQMIKANPQITKWHLVMDCLNIHQSESLVRWVASFERIPEVILGKKGQSGCDFTHNFATH
jgi:hypothetical protein